eukprot:8656552-Pyramimonas_sp.AAC.1
MSHCFQRLACHWLPVALRGVSVWRRQWVRRSVAVALNAEARSSAPSAAADAQALCRPPVDLGVVARVPVLF